MKSYDWNSLQDVDMDIVRKDEEDFDDAVGEFADEETGEEYDDDEEECGNGADIEECEAYPHFEYCMGVDSPNTSKATCIEITITLGKGNILLETQSKKSHSIQRVI